MFDAMALADITSSHVGEWERKEHAAGYAVSSVKTWRGTLHLILADAVDEGIIEYEPREQAARPRKARRAFTKSRTGEARDDSARAVAARRACRPAFGS